MNEVAVREVAGEIVTADCLPDTPVSHSVQELHDACRGLFQHRQDIIENATVETAHEGLRRALAIEKYVSDKHAKDDAIRAARVLETAVGAALGDSPGHGPGRGKKVDHDQSLIDPADASRFRRMAKHRAIWWPLLDEKALSRKKVLQTIDDALRPLPDGEGEAIISHLSFERWLPSIGPADLLLTDPPYSTDVDDIGEFVSSWLPLALSRLKPSARAFVFIGAYADEFGAYFSRALPAGWQWGVPNAWCYRNTIGPTPEYDFVRNWQCMLTARGPDAPPLHSDRITDLLAGFTENAPDGRHETKLHRWQKPLPLVDRLIRLATDPGDTVIDPFAGSGTTLIACKEAERTGLGCDADTEAVETCIGRGCDAG